MYIHTSIEVSTCTCTSAKSGLDCGVHSSEHTLSGSPHPHDNARQRTWSKFSHCTHSTSVDNAGYMQSLQVRELQPKPSSIEYPTPLRPLLLDGNTSNPSSNTRFGLQQMRRALCCRHDWRSHPKTPRPGPSFSFTPSCSHSTAAPPLPASSRSPGAASRISRSFHPSSPPSR